MMSSTLIALIRSHTPTYCQSELTFFFGAWSAVFDVGVLKELNLLSGVAVSMYKLKPLAMIYNTFI